MSSSPHTVPPGWYPAAGDPPGTQRYWNGSGWEGQARPIPGVVASDAFPLARLLKRVGARAIDLVVWLVITVVVDLVTGLAGVPGTSIAVSFAGMALYETIMVMVRGATVGKLVFDLAVVKADGSPADTLTSLRRALLLWVAALVSIYSVFGYVAGILLGVVAIVGLVMIYGEQGRQTPWDKLGQTLVVNR